MATKMEKRYDAKRIELEMQKLWEEHQVYRFQEDERPVFSIDTPPPTVSGSLHIGHIFSYTQAEILARYKRMRGYNVFYPFGFDDNGLPTERLVERDHKIRAKDLSREKFSTLCRETVENYVGEFQALCQSLGFSTDWSQQYDTASPETWRISQRLFLELAEAGKAYAKESPVLWCTECATSIAQAELETKEIDSVFHYLPFAGEEGVLEIATTRPELLYGCVCIFVHPDDERFRRFVGKTVRVPLYDFPIPVLADEGADREKGTGAVMCATYGDSADVQWAQAHRLPYKRVLLPDGTIAPDVPFLGGMPVRKAREEIVRLLEERGLLLHSEPLRHAVAIHERCGREVEILPSRQWYIDVLSERERYLQAAEEIEWHPEAMKKRYTAWVENLKWDWCISRQRYFGVPIPVWYCKECGAPMLAREEDLPVNPLERGPGRACPCGCTEFIPETAVLDTWATSSITPQLNARTGEPRDRSEKLLPMSLRTQAHEIIRTWTFYTIVRSLFHTGRVPWKNIMISGFVLAKKGEKISKSKNNAADAPSALVERYSADVLRLWTANARLGADTFFSPEDLDIPRRFVTKLYNAAKFALPHLEDFQPGEAPPEELLPADRWMLERVRQTTSAAAALLDQYEIGSARHEIDSLFWKDFCDHYLELVKERLYEPETFGAQARRSGQYALYHALLGILKLYAPYAPHLTEYLYQRGFRSHEGTLSLHQLEWSCAWKPNEPLLAYGEALKTAVAEARRYKSEHNLSMKAELEELTIQADEALLPLLRRTEADIRACCHVRTVRYLEISKETLP